MDMKDGAGKRRPQHAGLEVGWREADVDADAHQDRHAAIEDRSAVRLTGLYVRSWAVAGTKIESVAMSFSVAGLNAAGPMDLGECVEHITNGVVSRTEQCRETRDRYLLEEETGEGLLPKPIVPRYSA